MVAGQHPHKYGWIDGYMWLDMMSAVQQRAGHERGREMHRARQRAETLRRHDEERRREERRKEERRKEEQHRQLEELRRRQEQQRMEGRKRLEERRKLAENAKRARVHKERTERRMAEAWRVYEVNWGELAAKDQLKFDNIPWPTAETPKAAEEITPDAVKNFVLSPMHSQDMAPKDRIRNALRRWHPDKFGRVLGKVDEGNKVEVKEGADIVVRCLNEMLEKENETL